MDASDDGDPCTGRYPMWVRVVGWIVPRRPRPTATRPPVYVRDGPAFDRLAASRAISTDPTVSEPERERAQVIKTRVVYRRFRSCGNTFPPPHTIHDLSLRPAGAWQIVHRAVVNFQSTGVCRKQSIAPKTFSISCMHRPPWPVSC